MLPQHGQWLNLCETVRKSRRRLAGIDWTVGFAKQASKVVGKRLAERAKAAGIDAVYWDRKHGQKYHGKIKELLQTMQAEGLPLN